MLLTVNMMGSITGEKLPWYRTLRDTRLDLSASYIIREKKGQVRDIVEENKKVYWRLFKLCFCLWWNCGTDTRAKILLLFQTTLPSAGKNLYSHSSSFIYLLCIGCTNTKGTSRRIIG